MSLGVEEAIGRLTMDEVDAPFILSESSPRLYKRWSSAVKASSEFRVVKSSSESMKGFDEVDSSLLVHADSSSISKGFDEVDSGLVSCDNYSHLELKPAPLPEERGYELVSPAELALQLRAGLDRVSGSCFRF